MSQAPQVKFQKVINQEYGLHALVCPLYINHLTLVLQNPRHGADHSRCSLGEQGDASATHSLQARHTLHSICSVMKVAKDSEASKSPLTGSIV